MSPPIQSDTFIPDDNGPLIAVLSQPRIVETSLDGSTLVIEYTIRQSESQSQKVMLYRSKNSWTTRSVRVPCLSMVPFLCHFAIGLKRVDVT